ncbi:MAG: O-antigen ligase family protein [Solirubrobacteraceae bacterium]
MSLSERLAARNLRVIGFAFLIALCVGVAAGIQPRLGVAAALGVTFAAAVIADLTVGLFLFTILSFLEVVNAGSGAVSFIKVAGLILFLSWFAAQATRSRREARSLLASSPVITMAVVGFVSWSAISVAWAESSGTAIGSTSRFVLDALLFPIVFGAIRRREHFQWIVAAFVIGAVMSALIGLLQSGGARLAGGIGDPDGEAALLAAALMLDVGLIATLPRDSAAKTLAVIGALIMGLGLLDTGSRGGFVALVAVLVAAVLLGGRWRGRAAGLLLMVAIVTPVYLFVLAPSAAVQHLSSSSSSGRTDLWKVGLKMFEANPVAGVGSGNFTVASIHYVQQAGDITRADLIVDVPHAAHNTYLEIIDELGVPGFLMFLTIVIGSISAALRAARIYERRGDTSFELMSRGVALAVIALLTADFFITNEYEHLLWLLLALPPALLAVARSETRVRAS